MRFPVRITGLFSLVAAQGCATLEFLGGSCTQEQIVVTWPATFTRGTSVTTPLLTNTVTSQNIDKSQFDALRQALTGSGAAGTYNVTWTVPAFDVNGGYIALSHAAPLSAGQSQQVGTAFAGGGWGAQPAGAAFPPSISVRADNFTATSASGSITAIDTSPLRLRIDVTTSNAAGETLRLTGDAGFAYQKVTALCN